jgi:hypothetical protein
MIVPPGIRSPTTGTIVAFVIATTPAAWAASDWAWSRPGEYKRIFQLFETNLGRNGAALCVRG